MPHLIGKRYMSNSMDIKDLFKSSWIDFKETVISFLKLAWWPMLILIFIPNLSAYMEVDDSSWTSVFLSFGEMLATVLLALFSFISLFQSRNIEISLSARKIFVFWFASVFITIASSIATLFFLIPGLIILALSIFVPIFILYKNEGPIEAIASSSTHMRGQLLKLTSVFTLLWGIPLVFDYALLYLPLNSFFYVLASVLMSSIFAYFINSVAFNAYFKLDTINENSIQSTIDATVD
jgi:hypothetical protein